MKVVLMHGKDTDPMQKWYPWLGEEMKKHDIEFVAPVLPHADSPHIDEWVGELDKTNPDAETVLVGHSRGGVAVLRWLEKLPADTKVKKVILVATNSGFASKMAIQSETNYGFYTEHGYDFEKIKKHAETFTILHSRDDKWVPFSAGEENAKGLGAKFLAFDDRGHFGEGTTDIPELLTEIPA